MSDNRKSDQIGDCRGNDLFPGNGEILSFWKLKPDIRLYLGAGLISTLAELKCDEYLAYRLINTILMILQKRECNLEQKHIGIFCDEGLFEKTCRERSVTIDSGLPFVVIEGPEFRAFLASPKKLKQSLSEQKENHWIYLVFTLLYSAICPTEHDDDTRLFNEVWLEFLEFSKFVQKQKHDGIGSNKMELMQ